MRTFHVKQVFCICVWLLCAVARVHAQAPSHLETNARMIEDLARSSDVDPSRPLSVLSFVLHRLPDEVRVYPTENYYYFSFSHAGFSWSGSLRFGPDERARGQVELSVFKTLTAWNDTLDGTPRAILGAAEGVRVEMQAPFDVRVTLDGRSVLFRLNDLTHVAPPKDSLAPDERFIGPVHDESALRFFLVYNGRLKLFHFVLDETVPVADALEPLAGSDRIAVGRRTGFAFYRDHHRARQILIGVYEPNSRLNTWLDGPFDQLPENFIKGEELRDALIASDPEAKGAIDRLGHYLKEEGRYLIHPYMLYRKTSDLLKADVCARQRLRRPDLYARCFVFEPDVTSVDAPQPSRKR